VAYSKNLLRKHQLIFELIAALAAFPKNLLRMHQLSFELIATCGIFEKLVHGQNDNIPMISSEC
jgi:hypothetical protein